MDPGSDLTPQQNTGESEQTPVLPEFFRSSDAEATRAQRRHLRLSAIQLTLLLIAAAMGMVVVQESDLGTAWPPLVAACAFLLAALVKSHMLATRSESVWYRVRAAAEGVKTLAWRYAVGGEPVPMDLPSEVADEELLKRLQDVRASLQDVPVVPTGGALEQITTWMRDTRMATLHVRMEVYRRWRLESEEAWYVARASRFDKRAKTWGIATVCLEVVGAGAALLTGVAGAELGRFVGLSGLAATAVGVATSWSQTRQYRSLASSYLVTARQLGDTRVLMNRVDSEDEWTRCVTQMEDILSGEHEQWSSIRSL